jgi:DNA-binding NarL/FixJ family response regulator
MTAAIRVVIADDHPIIIDGVKTHLRRHPELALVGIARSFEEVVPLLEQTCPDVLVLDIVKMGGSVLNLMNRLHREYRTLGVVIFSSMVDLAPELLEAGARGYVTKDELAHELVAAIKAVAKGNLFVSPVVTAYRALAKQQTGLGPKELVALKLLVEGHDTAGIAEQMGINVHVAQNYITALRRKTGSTQRTQLIDWYRRRYGPNA